ncbi:MAG: 50S ribosomal protein L13 [Planctomycetes bacterium RBG_13_60_9]|nr:MAG: 50S ribosomal protein L13 [Planctomycetes bacterium RBG_13_60_9]
MKSFMAKENQVERKWRLVDADGAVLGRLAAKIAVILMGKDKPTYTPHVDVGDYIVVVNAEKIRLTGTKADTKMYNSYSRYPGGHKYTSFAHAMEKKPEWVVQTAVRKMLPKTQMGRRALKKLKIFRGPEHEHQAQQPEKVQLF